MRILILLVFLLISDILFCQEMLPFRDNSKWFFVSNSFKPVSKKTYSFLFPFQGQRAIVKVGGKYGVVDKRETIVIPCMYDTIAYSGENFFCRNKNVATWRNKEGQVYDQPIGCGSYSVGRKFFIYKKNNKFGLIVYNSFSKEMDSLPSMYTDIIEFFEGVGFAKRENKWGVINELGLTITDFTMDSVEIVNGNHDDPNVLQRYFMKEEMGFVNTKGSIVTTAKFSNSYFNLGVFTLVRTKDGNLGYIDSNGREYYK